LTELSKVKRNKPLMVLLLPVIVCMFLVGWAMYVTGQAASRAPQNPTKTRQTKQAKDHVTIGVIPVEESQEIVAH
jgi:flagellar basal body-associated protein FliL